MMQNKKTYYRKIALLYLLIVCFSSILCGAKTLVELDTETNIVYQSIGADKVLSDFSKDEKAAKNTYDDGYYLLYGNVTSKNKNNKEISVGAIDLKTQEKIVCKFSDRADINYVGGLSVGNTVRIYGKLSVGFKNALSLKAKGISKIDSLKASDDAYSVQDGNEIKKSSMKNRTIKNSSDEVAVSFYIPSDWQDVEHDISKDKLGSISGYQYRLNEINNKDPYAESFFVCYFDKNTGVDMNDKGNNKLIEEAILRNILDKDNLGAFPLKSVKTYYDAKYKYYRSTFLKSTGDKYKVEVVFQEKGDGILVYLYVYNNPRHVNDIMVMMRLLEL